MDWTRFFCQPGFTGFYWVLLALSTMNRISRDFYEDSHFYFCSKIKSLPFFFGFTARPRFFIDFFFFYCRDELGNADDGGFLDEWPPATGGSFFHNQTRTQPNPNKPTKTRGLVWEPESENGKFFPCKRRGESLERTINHGLTQIGRVWWGPLGVSVSVCVCVCVCVCGHPQAVTLDHWRMAAFVFVGWPFIA